jgi:hypothetical protein
VRDPNREEKMSHEEFNKLMPKACKKMGIAFIRSINGENIEQKIKGISVGQNSNRNILEKEKYL